MATWWAEKQVASVIGRLGLDVSATEIAELERLRSNQSMSVEELREWGNNRLAYQQEQEQIAQQNRQQVQTIARSLGLPSAFIDMFVNSFIESGGQTQVALAEIRESPQYEQYFPGNKLEDGRIRYSEADYLRLTDTYAQTLMDFGVNPDVFEGRFGDLISGEVAPDEFQSRIQTLYTRAIEAPEEVRRAYAQEFGMSDLTPEAIVGLALDTSMAEQVRARRMDVAELIGQSRRYGFNRDRDRAMSLLDEGLSAGQAQQLYSGAALRMPRLLGSAAVTGERTGIGDIEDAVLGDSEAVRRLARLDRQQSSRFSRAGNVVADRSGALTGLDT